MIFSVFLFVYLVKALVLLYFNWKKEPFSDKYFLVHPPKTGGTSLEVSMCGKAHACHDYVVNEAGACPNITQTNGKLNHFTKQQILDCGIMSAEEMATKTTVCTTRDPYARFISLVNHMGINIGKMRKLCDLNAATEHTKWFHRAACAPQTTYLGISGEECDVVFDTSELSTNGNKWLIANGFASVGHARDSRKRKRSSFEVTDMTTEDRAWVEEFYKSDFDMRAQLGM